MAHPWQYPRWRRILMQITLWLILCAVLGLAEWVTQHRRYALSAPMMQTLVNGPIIVKLPMNWIRLISPDNSYLLRAREPGAGRVLAVQQIDAGDETSSQDFLLHNLPPDTFVGGDDGEDDAPVAATDSNVITQPIKIAGKAGVVAELWRQQESAFTAQPIQYRELFACTILPSKEAIVLRLDCPVDDDVTEELHFMERVCEAMRVGDK